MSLRALLRIPFVALVSLAASGTIALSRPLVLVAPRLQLRFRNAAFKAWGQAMCRIMGARVEVEGAPPTGRFFLVANHLSYFDIMLIASQAPAAFVAKASLARWPLLGWMFLVSDTIFIDRGRKRDLLRVMQRVQKCLDRGMGVLIFPEGTSSKGEEVLRLKPSLLQLPAEQGHAVHYATLSYRSPGIEPAHETVCWWDDTPFPTHFVRLLGLPYFEASLRFGATPISDADRKVLADNLRAAMARSFKPLA